ncbi:MAG TPA: DUF2231 domain-containing protein [Candidatus Angelobacter sp.]|jgi:uncharacterized membrane protein
MNPFDLKSALLARHAQHVVLIHFPIALFLAGVAFDFAGQWRRNAIFATVAYYNITLAAVAALPVVATGLLAWRWQLEGQRLKGILLQHLVLGVATGAMICLVWSIHFYARRHARTPSIYRLPMEAIAAALIALTAYLGGFLSGVNAQV